MTLEKFSLRQKIMSFRKSLSKEEVRRKSAAIGRALLALSEFTSSGTIAFYVARPGSGEVETGQIIEETLKTGKRVLVPYVDRATKGISMAEINDPKTQLSPGAFGIPEPLPHLRKPVPLGEIDLVVVPGIAFDIKGNRLGHGYGYYDRLLKDLVSKNPKSRFIGLAYDFQVLDQVPNASHDIPVHAIVTETRVIRTC